MGKRPNKSLSNLKRYVKRHFYEIARPLGNKNSWFKVLHSKFRVMKTSGRKHFYDKKSGLFFFGKKNQYKDSLTIADTVPRYTYNEFSAMLFRYIKPGVNRRWLGVGEVNKIGVKALVSKPLESGKSPEVEVIMIISGTVMPKEF